MLTIFNKNSLFIALTGDLRVLLSKTLNVNAQKKNSSNLHLIRNVANIIIG